MSLKLVWGGWRMSNDMVVLKYGRGRRRRKNTSFDIKRMANRVRVVTRKRITFDKKPLSLIIIMIKSRLPWRQYQTWSCPHHSLSLYLEAERHIRKQRRGSNLMIFFIIFIRKNLIFPHNMWVIFVSSRRITRRPLVSLSVITVFLFILYLLTSQIVLLTRTTQVWKNQNSLY